MFRKSLACGIGTACPTALLVFAVAGITEYDANFTNGAYDPTIVMNWWVVTLWAVVAAALVGTMVFCFVWVREYNRAREPKRVPLPQPVAQ